MTEEKQTRGFGLWDGMGALSALAVVVLLVVFFGNSTQKNNEMAANIQPTVPAPTEEAEPEKEEKIEIAVKESDHLLGSQNASVTLIVFSDIQCPFCSKFHETLHEVVDEYEEEVRLIFRHFPLSFHPYAQSAAEASECAAEQGKFWEYLDMIFENNDNLDTASLKQYAKDLELDTDKFDKCLTEEKFSDKVAADMLSGQKAGVNGTPGTILIDAKGNTVPIRGALPFEQIQFYIEAALSQ